MAQPADATTLRACWRARSKFSSLSSALNGKNRNTSDNLAKKGFYAQIHEIFRLLKVPMAYAQSIPAKIASKSIGLRLSLKA